MLKHIDYYGFCNHKINIVDSDLSSFLREKFPDGEIHSNFFVVEVVGGEMFIISIREAKPISPDKLEFDGLDKIQ